MNSDDVSLDAFKQVVFNAGVSPGRGYVKFFADAMRWPVDSFAARTVSHERRFEHHVVWLRGNLIGNASYVAVDTPTLAATVRPLASVARIDIGAPHIQDNGFSQVVTRSMTVYFTDGDSYVVDPSAYSVWTQKEQADAFIDAVLDAAAAKRHA